MGNWYRSDTLGRRANMPWSVRDGKPARLAAATAAIGGFQESGPQVQRSRYTDPRTAPRIVEQAQHGARGSEARINERRDLVVAPSERSKDPGSARGQSPKRFLERDHRVGVALTVREQRRAHLLLLSGAHSFAREDHPR